MWVAAGAAIPTAIQRARVVDWLTPKRALSTMQRRAGKTSWPLATVLLRHTLAQAVGAMRQEPGEVVPNTAGAPAEPPDGVAPGARARVGAILRGVVVRAMAVEAEVVMPVVVAVGAAEKR